MSAVPEMRGYSAAVAGRAGVVALDSGSGAVQGVWFAPADGAQHLFGDLVVGDDGTVWITDSVTPAIWRLAPEADALERWLEHDEFISLQGIALTGDGAGLLLTAYGNGLLRIDIARRQARRVTVAVADCTLLGGDGLERHTDHGVLVIQNGVRPTRVLELTLDDTDSVVTSVRVLEAGHTAMIDPTLGCLTDDAYVFIGDAGWRHFGANAADDGRRRPVPVIRTRPTLP
jgi:streptogramin lyase